MYTFHDTCSGRIFRPSVKEGKTVERFLEYFVYEQKKLGSGIKRQKP